MFSLWLPCLRVFNWGFAGSIAGEGQRVDDVEKYLSDSIINPIYPLAPPLNLLTARQNLT
jgi:hypothetical protein